MSKIKKSETKLLIHDSPHPVRLLISLPFFIGGGYFIYHLLGSIREFLLYASISEWLAGVPGMLVMLLLAIAVSVPGLLLAATESIVVNRVLGVLGKRREFVGLHTRGKLVSVDDVARVICRRTTRKHTDRSVGSTSGRTSSTTVFLIDLKLATGSDWKPPKRFEYNTANKVKTLARKRPGPIPAKNSVGMDVSEITP